MIKFVSGDMFATSNIHYIGHGVNLRGVFGAGVAGAIAKKMPWAKIDYLAWVSKGAALGQIYISNPPSFRQGVDPAIVHLATQENPGPDANLMAIERSLLKLKEVMPSYANLALPQIGCGIGGLYWHEVKPVIEKVFADATFLVVVFESFVPGQPARLS